MRCGHSIVFRSFSGTRPRSYCRNQSRGDRFPLWARLELLIGPCSGRVHEDDQDVSRGASLGLYRHQPGASSILRAVFQRTRNFYAQALGRVRLGLGLISPSDSLGMATRLNLAPGSSLGRFIYRSGSSPGGRQSGLGRNEGLWQ